MQTHEIPTQPHRWIAETERALGDEATYEFAGHFESATGVVLAVETSIRRAPVRMKIGGWTAEGEGRVVTGGPMVRGPRAYAVPLAVIIDAHPVRRDETIIKVRVGDRLLLEGTAYEIGLVGTSLTLEPVS